MPLVPLGHSSRDSAHVLLNLTAGSSFVSPNDPPRLAARGLVLTSKLTHPSVAEEQGGAPTPGAVDQYWPVAC